MLATMLNMAAVVLVRHYSPTILNPKTTMGMVGRILHAFNLKALWQIVKAVRPLPPSRLQGFGSRVCPALQGQSQDRQP